MSSSSYNTVPTNPSVTPGVAGGLSGIVLLSTLSTTSWNSAISNLFLPLALPTHPSLLLGHALFPFRTPLATSLALSTSNPNFSHPIAAASSLPIIGTASSPFVKPVASSLLPFPQQLNLNGSFAALASAPVALPDPCHPSSAPSRRSFPLPSQGSPLFFTRFRSRSRLLFFSLSHPQAFIIFALVDSVPRKEGTRLSHAAALTSLCLSLSFARCTQECFASPSNSLECLVRTVKMK